MAITFQNQEINFKFSNKRKLINWIKLEIAKEKKACGQINFLFMDDAALLENNIKFLNHDTYTDIITFDSCTGKIVNGDIMISIERVLDNSQKFNVPFDRELHRVIIHGILHLCGYKDKKVADKALMRKKEDQAIKRLEA